MRIKEILTQTRRDFRADYECEHCGAVEKNKYGYDDANYHQNIIPKMRCLECGEVSPTTGAQTTPKYPEGLQL